MSRTIYMLDTNVLYNWMTACNPRLMAKKHFVKPETARQIRAFCENNENRICIPDLVWVEFLSGMLHKDIDVSGNFAKVRQWIRNQETMAQQIELMIENAPHLEWFVWDSDISPYPDAAALLQDTALINEATFRWMKESARYGKEKLLDGMDSVILIYLNELAVENEKDVVVLYTADYRLWRIFPRVRAYHKDWFQQNTGACALFPDVRCPKCQHSNRRRWNKLFCGSRGDFRSSA